MGEFDSLHLSNILQQQQKDEDGDQSEEQQTNNNVAILLHVLYAKIDRLKIELSMNDGSSTFKNSYNEISMRNIYAMGTSSSNNDDNTINNKVSLIANIEIDGIHLGLKPKCIPSISILAINETLLFIVLSSLSH